MLAKVHLEIYRKKALQKRVISTKITVLHRQKCSPSQMCELDTCSGVRRNNFSYMITIQLIGFSTEDRPISNSEFATQPLGRPTHLV